MSNKMNELDLKELIEFEDGKEYYIIERISHNKNFYVLFKNKEDNEDIMIQKEVLIDGEINFIGVESEEEFIEVITKFAKILDNRS